MPGIPTGKHWRQQRFDIFPKIVINRGIPGKVEAFGPPVEPKYIF